MIGPGACIGILGGGQLGRMTAIAAARLGYRCIVLAPEPECIAGDVAFARIEADYENEAALAEFARRVQVATIEFENVPAASLRFLGQRVPTRPAAAILDVTQDRLAEKCFVAVQGIAVADHAAVDDPATLEAALGTLGPASILKTRRMGYDGKGQVHLDDTSPQRAWDALGRVPSILERRVAFACEISVIVARSPSGRIACYPPVLNGHRDGILRRTTAPAAIPDALADEARAIAGRLARALRLEGLLAVEMFVTEDGRILVNELAPRPHNSGHWSIDASGCDQFEQLVRAICDLPLGDPTPFAHAVMDNLIGEEVRDWPTLLAEPGARLHLYGKSEIRAGRKMGHVTRIRPQVP